VIYKKVESGNKLMAELKKLHVCDKIRYMQITNYFFWFNFKVW